MGVGPPNLCRAPNLGLGGANGVHGGPLAGKSRCGSELNVGLINEINKLIRPIN